MDAAGLWKAVDGFEGSARTHPPTASHEPLQNRHTDAGFAQRPQAGETKGLLPWNSDQVKKPTSHVGDPGGNTPE